MNQPAWDRHAVITEIRDRIWMHLTAASTGSGVLLAAAALLRLPQADVDTLADLHWVLHPSVGELLDIAPGLLRRLKSTTARTTETGLAGVRGPVDWPATAHRRLLDRTPTVVTHPSVRDNDIPANRLLLLLLREIRDRAARLNLSATQTGTTGDTVADRGRRAASLAAHRGLREVKPGAPTARDLQALGNPRFKTRHAALLDAWHVYADLIRTQDPAALRTAVETNGLAAVSDGTLFEILVLFRVRDALTDQGWRLDPARLFQGSLRFRGRRGPDGLTCTYQGTPGPLRATSRYTAAQRAHGYARTPDLRPDLVLRHEAAGRPATWLLIEAKTTVTGKSRATLMRRALHDLLSYRWTYDTELQQQKAWGLGVVWGTGLHAAEHDVRVCTPDLLAEATGRLLA